MKRKAPKSCNKAAAVRAVACLIAAGCAALTGASANAATLPDNRGFELVSPPDTDGVTPAQYLGFAPRLLDGSRVIYGQGDTPIGDSPSGSNQVFLATRFSTGWSTSILSPPTVDSYHYWFLVDSTPSLSAAVFTTEIAELEGPQSDGNEQLAYRNAAGQFSTIIATPYGQYANYGGMSADGQSVIYSSAFEPSGAPTPGNLATVYDWHPDGSAAAIEGQPGDPLAGCSATVAQGPNSVSNDASTVFLTTQDAGCPGVSYVSIDGHSRRLAVPVNGSSDPGFASFVGATPDGRTAFMTSRARLTADAPGDGSNQLYQWSGGGGAPAVRCLTCSEPSGFSISGSVAVSSQGTYVYFVSGSSLYTFHGGTLQLVASDVQPSVAPITFQMSADGHVVVYESSPAGLNPSAATYRSVIDGTQVSTQCLTCSLPAGAGVVTLGDRGSSFYRGTSTLLGGGDDALTADGDRVVVTVVGPTVNGQLSSDYQVDQWTPADGLQFLAAGEQNYGPTVSADGADILFTSPDALTFDAAAQPGTTSIFDARIGGGFSPPGLPGSCSGDACQGSINAGSSPTNVGSSSSCCGNLAGSRRPAIVVAPPSKADLRRAMQTGRLTIHVKVQAGRVRARLSARLKGHTRSVAFVSRRVTGSGRRSVSITFRLSAVSRKELRSHGRLSLELSVSSPPALSRTLRFTIQPARGTDATHGGHS